MQKAAWFLVVGMLACKPGGREVGSRDGAERDDYFFVREPGASSLGGAKGGQNPWLRGAESASHGGGGEPSGPSRDHSQDPATGGTGTGGGTTVGDEPPNLPPPSIELASYEETTGAHKFLGVRNLGRATLAGECEIVVFSNGNRESSRKIAVPPLREGEVMTLCTAGAPTEACQESLGAAPFNGDDALVLSCLGRVCDAFGRVGEDPGSEWSEGGIRTKDVKLIRCHHLAREPDALFRPALEWALWPDGTEAATARALACPSAGGLGGAGTAP